MVCICLVVVLTRDKVVAVLLMVVMVRSLIHPYLLLVEATFSCSHLIHIGNKAKESTMGADRLAKETVIKVVK